MLFHMAYFGYACFFNSFIKAVPVDSFSTYFLAKSYRAPRPKSIKN